VATKRGIQYIPAIDGLRAIAVIAVILYHLGVSWIPGGFLGVDLFFVISGYVITRLLLDSIQSSGGLDLRAFYLARMRRLLPPLIFMVATTLIYIGIFATDTTKRFIQDLPFSITGLMNWWLVFRQQDYFEAIARPPLLQHTWSLAVEAQFYLIWPLILLLVLKYFGKKKIPGAALFIAAISGIALMVVSFELDASSGSAVSHVYFGTDTHSIGLFLGAALAVSWIPQNFNLEVSQKAQDFIDGIGVFGFIGVLATFLFIDETEPTLYRIAFPLVGLFGVAILISIVHPSSRFAPLLRNRVLLWIGERSYAIYLWHWVVFQLTRPSVDLEGKSWALFALRILLVAALADLSLRWVELPIRSGAVRYWIKGLKYRKKSVRRRQITSISALIAIFVFAAASLSFTAIKTSEEKSLALQESLTVVEVAPAAPVNSTPTNEGIWVTGDSVILGIRHDLGELFPISLINARVGRQAPELLSEISKDKESLGDIPVVLNLGNNGALSPEVVTAILEALKGQRETIIVNTAVPRPWREANNKLLNELASSYSSVNIVDWADISQGHPEYFAPDGVHLVPLGVTAYVQAITQYLK
jgi:peptidoglycan/LPS O-acetylase OafA/YrhL